MVWQWKSDGTGGSERPIQRKLWTFEILHFVSCFYYALPSTTIYTHGYRAKVSSFHLTDQFLNEMRNGMKCSPFTQEWNGTIAYPSTYFIIFLSFNILERNVDFRSFPVWMRPLSVPFLERNEMEQNDGILVWTGPQSGLHTSSCFRWWLPWPLVIVLEPMTSLNV